jgi:hypothetical protein
MISLSAIFFTFPKKNQNKIQGVLCDDFFERFDCIPFRVKVLKALICCNNSNSPQPIFNLKKWSRPRIGKGRWAPTVFALGKAQSRTPTRHTPTREILQPAYRTDTERSPSARSSNGIRLARGTHTQALKFFGEKKKKKKKKKKKISPRLDKVDVCQTVNNAPIYLSNILFSEQQRYWQRCLDLRRRLCARRDHGTRPARVWGRLDLSRRVSRWRARRPRNVQARQRVGCFAFFFFFVFF